jgi:hypothetical protein
MRLLKCQVFEIFFGGARGGGKTDGVLGEFGAHASRYGKDAIGLMVRRTRAELVENGRGKSTGRSAGNSTTRRRCGVRRTAPGCALPIWSAMPMPTCTRATTTREFM